MKIKILVLTDDVEKWTEAIVDKKISDEFRHDVLRWIVKSSILPTEKYFS